MYINFQQAILGASALTGSLYKKQPGSEITSGTILDYCVQKCIDEDGNQRCTAPVLLKKSTKYHVCPIQLDERVLSYTNDHEQIEWSTEGALSHTTMEVRDAKSNEIVYYKE